VDNVADCDPFDIHFRRRPSALEITAPDGSNAPIADLRVTAIIRLESTQAITRAVHKSRIVQTA